MANITIILGSVRKNRIGINVARFVNKQLKAKGHKVTLIDPIEYKLPLLNKMYKEYPKGKAPEKLTKLAKIYKKTDAFVIVSAEYNHSIPPALSNLLDHFLEEYFWRPSAIVCYSVGSFAGVRAGIQLRAMLCELGMPSIPSMFPVGKVKESIDKNGNAIDKAYERRIKKFIAELEWYTQALKEQRKKGTPY